MKNCNLRTKVHADGFFIALAFLFGLNLPRSFSLLALLCAIGFIYYRKLVRSMFENHVILLSSSMLVLFGFTYAVSQFQFGSWVLNAKGIANSFTFICLPAACLLIGYLFRVRAGSSMHVGPAIVFAFALGGMLYVSISLMITRHPWWNPFAVLQQSITVPWGEHGISGQNIRSVEQRYYPAFAILASLPLILTKYASEFRSRIIVWFFTGFTSLYLAWSLHSSKLASLCLILAFSQYIFLIPSLKIAIAIVIGLACASALLIRHGILCDERIPLQINFIQRISEHPWGGRQISFDFKGCPGQTSFHFGPPPGLIHLPHNIFLDVVNDAGILSALFLLIACSILLIAVLNCYAKAFTARSYNMWLSLGWGILVIVVIQSMFQSLLYSDRLLFCLAFSWAGAMIADFSTDSLDISWRERSLNGRGR
jgi:hypothetical protein